MEGHIKDLLSLRRRSTNSEEAFREIKLTLTFHDDNIPKSVRQSVSQSCRRSSVDQGKAWIISSPFNQFNFSYFAFERIQSKDLPNLFKSSQIFVLVSGRKKRLMKLWIDSSFSQHSSQHIFFRYEFLHFPPSCGTCNALHHTIIGDHFCYVVFNGHQTALYVDLNNGLPHHGADIHVPLPVQLAELNSCGFWFVSFAERVPYPRKKSIHPHTPCSANKLRSFVAIISGTCSRWIIEFVHRISSAPVIDSKNKTL